MFDLIARYPIESLLILLLAVLTAFLCWLAAIKVIEIYRMRHWGPHRVLLNQLARVVTPISMERPGKVHVYGEIWDAICEDLPAGESIAEGTEVQVIGFDRLDPRRLKVSRTLKPPAQTTDID